MEDQKVYGKFDTESKILEAAKKVFVEKGLDGARMQEIADEAKINKALLHYYYRSKNKLFEAVFVEAFKNFLPKISKTLMSDSSIEEIISTIVASYIELLQNNPHIPIFVLHELNRNPEMIVSIIKSSTLNPQLITTHLLKKLELENKYNINVYHLIINMISMCVFPFIAKPIIQNFVFENDAEKYKQFISERKKEITNFIMNSITKE